MRTRQMRYCQCGREISVMRTRSIFCLHCREGKRRLAWRARDEHHQRTTNHALRIDAFLARLDAERRHYSWAGAKARTR